MKSSLLYQKFKKHLPASWQSNVAKLVVTLGRKPIYRKTDIQRSLFPGQEKGGMIISADFEMAWAFRYSKKQVNPLTMANLERENIPILLKQFETFNIPITWATVGHLMLDHCNKGDHDWMSKIPYFDDHWRYVSGDWFDADPYTDYKKDSAWYAPDLIEKILASKTQHEIGCHTFSHLNCKDKICPPEVLRDDLKACIDAGHKWGIEYKSFVFPGGTFGNFNVLKQHGFKIYRRSTDYQLALPYQDENGLLISSTTYGFGKNYNWDAETYIIKFKRFIDYALKSNTIAHFWLHPSIDQWSLNYVIPQVLNYASDLREKGILWIGTMGQIAELVEKED